MKRCPACQKVYEDAQNFCLDDGTTLVSAAGDSSGSYPPPPPPPGNPPYSSSSAPTQVLQGGPTAGGYGAPPTAPPHMPYMMSPTPKKSPLPWIMLGVLVLVGAGVSIILATRGSGSTTTTTGGRTPSTRPSSVYTGPPLNDIEYAKKVFQLLGDGDESVKSMIDWEHLKMMGVDVGALYTNTRGDAARDIETSSFIRGYSNSFKKSGGSVANLTNWREQSRDATNTVVAADSQRGQLVLITITHINGQQKVSTLELK